MAQEQGLDDRIALTAEKIRAGKTSLGIEFGSTRIKAVLIDDTYTTIAAGDYGWASHLEDGLWSYSQEEIWTGLQTAYAALAEDVENAYGEKLTRVGRIGFSAMMHGYLAFDKNGELLVPFRTWQNTNTSEAHEKLSELFQYNIPERWSIAHLYQAVLNDEEHIGKVDFFTTLAGYVHWKLTGKKVLGVGDASGMFPIDPTTHTYETEFIEKFNAIPEVAAQPWKLADLLPEPLVAGTPAGTLTEEGAKLLDPTGTLQPGITFAPPEGDAGTGMVATNSVRVRTGNVSAGTSIFAMVVLEHKLERLHPDVDLVTTPAGDLARMGWPVRPIRSRDRRSGRRRHPGWHAVPRRHRRRRRFQLRRTHQLPVPLRRIPCRTPRRPSAVRTRSGSPHEPRQLHARPAVQRLLPGEDRHGRDDQRRRRCR